MSNLWNINISNLTQEDKNQVLEQYKLYVEMADRISSRRDNANSFFLGVNSFLTGLISYFIDKGNVIEGHLSATIILIVLLVECFIWYRLIISYKQLNTAKFQVVGELEEALPSSPYHKAEWKDYLKEGKVRSIYWPLSHVESKIPMLFSVLYILIFVTKQFCLK